MTTEREGQNREKFLKLIQENPDIPIVPIVNGEIPGDDSGSWIGAWGYACVDEYLITNNRERLLFKSDGDVFDVLERHLSDEEFEKLPETESECRNIYDDLPWTKAIVVYIELP